MKTAKTSKLPPFYTQIMGSFPQPRVVLDLLTRREEFTAERYAVIMDDLVRFAIRTQGLTGLDVVSDGRWRGSHQVSEFLLRAGGFESARTIAHQGETKLAEVIVKRMNPTGSVFKADGDFLVNNTARVTKFMIPSPVDLALRYWEEKHSKGAYATRQDFLDHLMTIMAAEVHTLVTAGVDIIQIDDAVLMRVCGSGAGSEGKEVCGGCEWDAEGQLSRTLGAINRLADSALGKVEIHLHCRQSRCPGKAPASLDYKPVFGQLKGLRIDRVNIGFTGMGTERIRDLAALPENIDVGMGILDMRPGKMQTAVELQTLAQLGASMVAPGRIALGPDCSCGSGVDERPTMDEVYDKLRRLTAASRGLRARHT